MSHRNIKEIDEEKEKKEFNTALIDLKYDRVLKGSLKYWHELTIINEKGIL